MKPHEVPTKLLQQWSDFLDAQMAHFESVIVAGRGRPHSADATNVAFLAVDEVLLRDELDEAAEQFIRANEWPTLDAKRALHLQHRAYAASGLLLSLLQLESLPPGSVAGMPDLSERDAVIRWLLIDLWKLAGPSYIEALTDRFIADNP